VDDPASAVGPEPDRPPDDRATTGKGAARHRPARRLLLFGVGLVLLVAVGATVAYRHQVVSYFTHTKGSPTHTEPYVAYDPPPRVHLAAVGDIGHPGGREDATANAVALLGKDARYDALLLLGDNVYPSGDPAMLDDTVFGPFAVTLAQGTVLLAILGNHDVKDGHGDAQMAALGMPGRWWAQRIDDVLIVGLDSTRIDDPVQKRFLEDTLRETDARWRIVLLHHPPFSAGYQGSDHEARDVVEPIAERYGVQLVLSGHDHDYQRSKVIDGVTYVVSGAASDTRRTGTASFTAMSFSWHHFLDIAVFDDRLVLRAVNQDERVADEVTILP
jgi:predicted phosphodiesterase